MSERNLNKILSWNDGLLNYQPRRYIINIVNMTTIVSASKLQKKDINL